MAGRPIGERVSAACNAVLKEYPSAFASKGSTGRARVWHIIGVVGGEARCLSGKCGSADNAWLNAARNLRRRKRLA